MFAALTIKSHNTYQSICFIYNTAAPPPTSGLGSALQAVLRTRVPANVLNVCSEADRVVVENIIILAQELIPLLDVTACSVDKKHLHYRVHIPVSAQTRIGLRELRAIEAYSPARVTAVSVQTGGAVGALCIDINDQHCPISCTELDVVRICKRRRFLKG